MAKSKRARKAGGIRNAVVISDEHMICRLGLCPPEGVVLDDGGAYTPSKLQRKVWNYWREFWDEWVPTVTRGEPFCVVNNGDAIDGGAHHNNKTHISDNENDQRRLALAVLRPVVEACEGRYYHIRGTEVHAGRSGVNEEALAESLGAIPNKEGQYARWDMWMRLGVGLSHFSHHIGTTGSMHYESTALMRELSEAYVEAGRWGDEPPDVVVRSHRHRNAEVRVQTRKGFATVCTTAGWQLKTPLCYRIAGARQTTPQFGGSLVRCGDEDTYTRHFVRGIARDEEVAP